MKWPPRMGWIRRRGTARKKRKKKKRKRRRKKNSIEDTFNLLEIMYTSIDNSWKLLHRISFCIILNILSAFYYILIIYLYFKKIALQCYSASYFEACRLNIAFAPNLVMKKNNHPISYVSESKDVFCMFSDFSVRGRVESFEYIENEMQETPEEQLMLTMPTRQKQVFPLLGIGMSSMHGKDENILLKYGHIRHITR
jgi:hypothetical protein